MRLVMIKKNTMKKIKLIFQYISNDFFLLINKLTIQQSYTNIISSFSHYLHIINIFHEYLSKIGHLLNVFLV